MSPSFPYVLDSDVLIAAKNSYYAFAICPGFWDSLIHLHGEGHVSSIDKVRGELLLGRETEDLVQWVKCQLPAAFFLETGEEAVLDAYGRIMLWVQRNPQYFDSAKAKFATGADGWLVAHAMVHGVTVVTNEQSEPAARREIKLPDVCIQFNVTHRNTFEMLTALGARYVWEGST